MKDALAAYVVERRSALERERSGIESDVHEINRLVAPSFDASMMSHAGGFNNSAPTSIRDELDETTAARVHRTLQKGLMAHLTAIGSQWFALQPADAANAPASLTHWTHYASQTLMRLLSPGASNFYTALSRSYFMDGAFGTSVLIPRLSRSKRLVFDSLPILTYSIAVDAEEIASTLCRVYQLSAQQCSEMFGDDCPGRILKDLEKAETKGNQHRIIHLIEPNPDHDPALADQKHMKFRSIYVDEEDVSTIREEGLHEQPHAVAVWEPSPTGAYGVSPFHEVIPDIRDLQNLARNRAILVERAGNPPWFIPAGYDGQFDPRPHGRNLPGGRGTVDELMPREMPVTGRLDFLQAEAADKEERIKEAGHFDLFRMLTSNMNRDKTAYEVRQLEQEKTALFHPFYAAKTQQLTQVIRRSLALALRAGLIAPPPEEAMIQQENGEFGLMPPEVIYNSRLARALEINESNAIIDTVNELMPLAGQEGLSSPIFDWLNLEKAPVLVARSRGISAAAMADPKEIAAKQEARAQAAQAAQQQAAAQTLTQGVRDLGGVEGAQQAAELIAP